MHNSELATAWDSLCDALDVAFSPEATVQNIEDYVATVVAKAQRMLAVEDFGLGLPPELISRICEQLDTYAKETSVRLAEWRYLEERSRRMARGIGRAVLLDLGYVTTGESNWLTNPSMRGFESLHEALK